MFTCAQCAKRYKRPEHLQRHLATHSDARPYECQLCNATFQRSDVLRRHSKTCIGLRLEGTNEPPANAPELLAQETSIDSGAGGDCLEDFSAYLDWLPDVDEYADLLASDFLPADLLLRHNRPLPTILGETSKTVAPLRFLEGFTRDSGLVASFDCGTQDQRIATSLYLRANNLLQQQSCTDLLAQKCGEIHDLLKEVCTIKPRNSPVDLTWSPSVTKACTEFFSPWRVELYLGLFWAVWHPNVNFVHRATFDPRTAKAAIVAAMTVIGAAVSPDRNDNEQARLWFNAVEEMVFVDDDFCSGITTSPSFPTLAKIQSLQAAYIVCLYQNWEGTESSKARVRRFRYSTVVAMARDLGINNARHFYASDTLQRPKNWLEFAKREQLIRTLLWVFLLDTAFVIFHNFPPRMAIKEMKMHFASHEGSFQSSTAEEWAEQRSGENANTQYTLASLVERMCAIKLDLGTQAQLAGLGPLNLFVVTSAFHVMIFQAQQAFNVKASLRPLSNALDNWMAIWQVFCGALQQLSIHNPLVNEEVTPGNMWKRVGFSRFADEYWLLAKLVTEKMNASSQTAGFLEGDRSDAVEGSLTGAIASAGHDRAILPRYDENSMRQVNDLISDFQRILL